MYSGEGYSYLQSVVSRLTGRVDTSACGTFENDVKFCATDIADYMKANLFTPMGMPSSRYFWDDGFAAVAARPHDAKGQRHRQLAGRRAPPSRAMPPPAAC